MIENIELFRSLSAEAVSEIDRLLHWSQFKPGQNIITEADPTSDLFFIAKGTVVAKSYSMTGKEVTYFEFSQGEMFGEFSAVDGEVRASHVVSKDHCTIASISGQQFQNLLLSQPVLSLEFSKHLVRKIRSLSLRVFEYGTASVRCRLHAHLLRSSKKDQENNQAEISPTPTHYEIATRISTHREAVSRELSRLAKLGLIETKPNAIIIRDLKQFEQFVMFTSQE